MSAPHPTYEDEEDAMYREEDHDRDERVPCRRCDELALPDELVDGLCPGCMEAAGLVQCLHCGRSFDKKIARVVKKGMFVEYYCPFCKSL